MSVESSRIEELMESHSVYSPYHDRADAYGERCWRIGGELFDVVYWDCGNGWAWVQQVILWEPPDRLTEENIRLAFEPSKDYARVYRELAEFFGRLAGEEEAQKPAVQVLD